MLLARVLARDTYKPRMDGRRVPFILWAAVCVCLARLVAEPNRTVTDWVVAVSKVTRRSLGAVSLKGQPPLSFSSMCYC